MAHQGLAGFGKSTTYHRHYRSWGSCRRRTIRGLHSIPMLCQLRRAGLLTAYHGVEAHRQLALVCHTAPISSNLARRIRADRLKNVRSAVGTFASWTPVKPLLSPSLVMISRYAFRWTSVHGGCTAVSRSIALSTCIRQTGPNSHCQTYENACRLAIRIAHNLSPFDLIR